MPNTSTNACQSIVAVGDAKAEACLFRNALLAETARKHQAQQAQAASEFARRFLLAEDRARFLRNEKP